MLIIENSELDSQQTAIVTIPITTAETHNIDNSSSTNSKEVEVTHEVMISNSQKEKNNVTSNIEVLRIMIYGESSTGKGWRALCIYMLLLRCCCRSLDN